MDANDGRDANGRWLPGTRGGPGRRPGTTLRKSFAAVIGEKAVEQIGRKIKSMALDGDPTALRIASERIWPALTRSELSGVDGEAIQVEAPDWKSFSTDELQELRSVAAAIQARRKARMNGNGNGAHEPGTPVSH